MAHNKHGDSNYDPIPDTGHLYETRDVALSALVKWVAFLFFFVGATAFVSFFIYKAFVPQGEEARQYPTTRMRPVLLDPLQADPVADIKHYRTVESASVNSYGSDPRTGTVHIPVDRAIDLVLPDLPTRPGAGTVDISKTTAPNTPPEFDGQAPGSTPKASAAIPQNTPEGTNMPVNGTGNPTPDTPAGNPGSPSSSLPASGGGPGGEPANGGGPNGGTNGTGP